MLESICDSVCICMFFIQLYNSLSIDTDKCILTVADLCFFDTEHWSQPLAVCGVDPEGEARPMLTLVLAGCILMKP